MTERVVLAYSGGLDTSVAIGWIAEQTGAEIIALAVDVGQGGEDLDTVRERALACGAADAEVADVRAEFAAELLVTAEASANLVVLRTPAGAAQFLASVLDHSAWPSILGTVAGDDTVLVIARDPAGGADLARALLRLAERRSH